MIDLARHSSQKKIDPLFLNTSEVQEPFIWCFVGLSLINLYFLHSGSFLKSN